MTGDSLRICLLTYRGNPRCGGQGIYVRLLSRELADLGHTVDVWSGQPYPELMAGVGLVKVPSLDLWNDAALLRWPGFRELRDPINRFEYAQSVTGGFVEPMTFCSRVARRFQENGHRTAYDIVHDNQALGADLIKVSEHVPVVATIHHPITIDRKIGLQSAGSLTKRLGLLRWYTFVPSHIRTARRLDRIITISDSSARDLQTEYKLRPDQLRVVGNGINLEVFRPMPEIARDPNRLITILSADAPLKGFPYLVAALAELRRTRPALKLTVIGAPGLKSPTRSIIEQYGLHDAIEFTGKVEFEELARRYAQASVAVVPSLYEGFSFPAGEAMACEVPVVASRAGAIPEVIGTDGRCGVLVPPRSPEALAREIAALLDAPERRVALGKAGRERVLKHFTWRKAAERHVEVYREVIAQRGDARIAC
jgi:glycosyltransferase involved in cell wall biosynthesis